MTDKQIIIDGVDVSGCDFYDKNKKYCLTVKMNPTGFKNPSCFSGDFQECIQDSKTCPYTFCDNNPNCYYKQLKRKEQECETLASQLDFEVQKKECLEQECEELKEDLRKSFEEKDTLHLIIDRLLEASGYDTNTASAEDFEDVYENMRYEKQQLDQLKAENDELKKEVDDLLHKPEIQDKILWKIDNETLLGSKDAYIYKLEQTLTEIKEIAEKGFESSQLTKLILDLILQKISEVGE